MIDVIWPIFGCFPIDHHRIALGRRICFEPRNFAEFFSKSPAAVLSSSGLSGLTTELSSMTSTVDGWSCNLEHLCFTMLQRGEKDIDFWSRAARECDGLLTLSLVTPKAGHVDDVSLSKLLKARVLQIAKVDPICSTSFWQLKARKHPGCVSEAHDGLISDCFK